MDHRPRKRFGQHFLTDHSILNRIVSALGPKPGQQILEIGPGLGALTNVLLEKVSRLTVVELDRDLAQRLVRRYSPERVSVIQADILSFNLGDAIAAGHPNGQVRLIGNLPYNISTPLIFHLLEQIDCIADMLFMLQREVAMRLAAEPGNRNYGRLTVMAAMALDCEPLFNVPPEAFDPPPKVDSTVLRLIPKPQPLVVRDRKLFNNVVAAAFSQRRKTLRNALKALVQPEHFTVANIDPGLRAEALSVHQFITLADSISGTSGAEPG